MLEMSAADEMTYLTDGVRLFEVVSRRSQRNFGRLGGEITYTIVRDCVSEEMATLDDLHMATLSAVA